MKIYNEIITIFNDLTDQWETIYEDSFEHNGPLALAQGLPPNATAISAQDTIADTVKTTAGYFTNGDGTLSGVQIHTGSLADSNEKYYFNVTHAHPKSSSAEVQFSVTFGHILGSGSNQYGDTNNNPTNLNGESKAIYKQFTNLLMEETEASGGFKISSAGNRMLTSGSNNGGKGIGVGGKDEYIYVLVGKRARFKDRMNKKAWTLVLSGSGTAAKTNAFLVLTDDSKNVMATATPGGPRYNIVSGALGVVHTPATTRTFGFFYPEMGTMVFSGAELSASIPGPRASLDDKSAGSSTTASFCSFNHVGGVNSRYSSSGFTPNLNSKGNAQNALRLVNCMRNTAGNALRIRSEEDQTQENYFCRIKAANYNFSANPTFVSGGLNKLRHTSMHGNPQTFITGIGLYNSAGQLLATAKLSSPLKKNFASEATIKVKLTY